MSSAALGAFVAGVAFAFACAFACAEPATPTPNVALAPPPPVASSLSTPVEPLPKTLRFPVGAPTPRPGCFAWSERDQAFACVWGQYQPDPEYVSLWVEFVGRESRPKIRILHGMLDEPSRVQLDASMLAGSYVAVAQRAWTAAGVPLEDGKFRVLSDAHRFRVEHTGKEIFQRKQTYIPKFTPTCELRISPAAPRLVIEWRCRVVDEGVEVTDLDVFGCDEEGCR